MSVLGTGKLMGLASRSANAIKVAPGDIIKVDNFSGISSYPYLAGGLLFGLSSNTLTFDYSVFDGVAPTPVTMGNYSRGLIVDPFTLQNATAYILLVNFNGTGDIIGGLYAPDLCAEVPAGTTPCAPLRVGQSAKINAGPLPAALPLFAASLGAMGLIPRPRKREVAVATMN